MSRLVRFAACRCQRRRGRLWGGGDELAVAVECLGDAVVDAVVELGGALVVLEDGVGLNCSFRTLFDLGGLAVRERLGADEVTCVFDPVGCCAELHGKAVVESVEVDVVDLMEFERDAFGQWNMKSFHSHPAEDAVRNRLRSDLFEWMRPTSRWPVRGGTCSGRSVSTARSLRLRCRSDERLVPRQGSSRGC
jgi:hypothetical protein